MMFLSFEPNVQMVFFFDRTNVQIVTISLGLQLGWIESDLEFSFSVFNLNPNNFRIEYVVPISISKILNRNIRNFQIFKKNL